MSCVPSAIFLASLRAWRTVLDKWGSDDRFVSISIASRASEIKFDALIWESETSFSIRNASLKEEARTFKKSSGNSDKSFLKGTGVALSDDNCLSLPIVESSG